MAIRQYIGARYVPKYMGTFDSTIAYEPLSVVDDANGNSYTSKIPVPAGTDLSNRTYWAPTGNFSGAVLQLQNRMTAAEGNITDLQGAMTAAQGDISNLQDDMTTAQGDISNLQDDMITAQGDISSLQTSVGTLISNKILFIADSYGGRLYQNKNISELFTEYTGVESELSWEGSTGFGAALKFLSPLTNYSGDKTEISKIIVVGGANDLPASSGDILAGMREFRDYAKANYSNLKEISLFVCGVAFAGEGNTYIKRNNLIRNYIDAASILGISVVTNSQYVLHDTALLESDFVHPNGSGVNAIAKALGECYINDVANVDKHFAMSISLNAGNSIPDNYRIGWIYQNLKNGKASLTAMSGILFDISFTGDARPYTRANGTTSVANIGNTRTLIFNGGNIAAAVCQARITLANGGVKNGFAFLYFGNGTMHMYFVMPDLNYTAVDYVTAASIYNTYVEMMAD